MAMSGKHHAPADLSSGNELPVSIG